jgi:hypothetical protein
MTSKLRKSIDDHVRAVFRKKAFTAVYVAGPSKLVWVSDNRKSRPIKLGHSAALKDTISDVLDGAAYQAPQRVLFRIWVMGKPAAKLLEDHLRARAEGLAAVNKLRKAWVDMGPDFDESMFELEVRSAAETLGLQCWNDDELYFHMAEIVMKKMKNTAEAFA